MSLKILTFLILVINYVYGKEERIIGGSHAQRFNFPYQVILKRISDNALICGGAIISNYHIITAAHCVDEYSVLPNDLKIRFGGFNQTHLFQSEYLPYHIMIHPEYVRGLPEQRSHNNDIAVIRTRADIQFGRYQNRILLPDKNIEYGVRASTSGWGTVMYPILSFASKLQSVKMLIMYPSICETKMPIPINGDQFCVFKDQGIGSCVGDGGNPLVKRGRLIGLFSMSYLCASGLPDVYTNVYAHMPFITSAMEA